MICLFFIALLSSMPYASLGEDAPATVDDIASRHQDAILSLKQFSFNSSVTLDTKSEADGGAAPVVFASGTVVSDDWSNFVSTIGLGNGTSTINIEYFEKDDFYFRDVKIAHPEVSESSDTTQGWDDVEPEVFRREVPFDPIHLPAAFIGNHDAVSQAGTRTSTAGIKCNVYVISETEEDGAPSVSFCVSEESGLILEFEAAGEYETGAGSSPSLSRMKLTQIENNTSVSPPEKILTLYTDEKERVEKEKKENPKKKKK